MAPADLDPMARHIFQQALAEDRCGELLDALFNGASATVDAHTHRLLIIPAHVMAEAAGDTEDDTLCGCGDRLSERLGARCGNCRAAFESGLERAVRAYFASAGHQLQYRRDAALQAALNQSEEEATDG